MADPTITRDILRGALNKHIDNDSTEAFEQVITALGGLEKEVEHRGATDEAKELRRTARHAAIDPPPSAPSSGARNPGKPRIPSKRPDVDAAPDPSSSRPYTRTSGNTEGATMAGGDYTGRTMEIAERRNRVVEARDADGLTFRAIAEQEGVDVHTVYRDYQRARRQAIQLTPEAVERAEQRKLAQLARIDEQRRDVEMQREAVMEVLTRDGRTVVTQSGKVLEDIQDDPTLLAAVDRLVKLDELLIKLDDQEAKLLGLYAKTEVNMTAKLVYEVHGLEETAPA